MSVGFGVSGKKRKRERERRDHPLPPRTVTGRRGGEDATELCCPPPSIAEEALVTKKETVRGRKRERRKKRGEEAHQPAFTIHSQGKDLPAKHKYKIWKGILLINRESKLLQKISWVIDD